MAKRTILTLMIILLVIILTFYYEWWRIGVCQQVFKSFWYCALGTK